MINSTGFEFENFKLTLNSTYYKIVVTVKLEFEHVLFRSTHAGFLKLVMKGIFDLICTVTF